MSGGGGPGHRPNKVSTHAPRRFKKELPPLAPGPRGAPWRCHPWPSRPMALALGAWRLAIGRGDQLFKSQTWWSGGGGVNYSPFCTSMWLFLAWKCLGTPPRAALLGVHHTPCNSRARTIFCGFRRGLNECTRKSELRATLMQSTCRRQWLDRIVARDVRPRSSASQLIEAQRKAAAWLAKVRK
jgi:hypothetical protein